MANYCSNSIVFFSNNKKMLKNLWNKINICLDNRQHNSVKYLLKLCGYTNNEANEIADGRDYFIYLDDVVHEEEPGVYYFRADTESAWSPNMDTFKSLLNDKYQGKINLLYHSEEPGCGIFLTNDFNRAVFSDKYRLDFDIGDKWITDYYSDFKELVDFVAAEFPKAKITIFDTVDSIVKKVTAAYNLDSEDDKYFCIDVFRYDEEI